MRRGSLTFWFVEEAVQAWRDDAASGPAGGRPRIYSDTAIECALVVRAVFHLSPRATQEFLGSVVELMGVSLPSLVDHQAVAVDIQALKRNGLSRDVAAKALELPTLMLLAGNGGVQ